MLEVVESNLCRFCSACTLSGHRIPGPVQFLFFFHALPGYVGLEGSHPSCSTGQLTSSAVGDHVVTLRDVDFDSDTPLVLNVVPLQFNVGLYQRKQ